MYADKKKKVKNCFLGVFLLSFFVFPESAIGGISFGGRGSVLLPLDGGNNIVLVDKEVNIRRIDGIYETDCLYTFHNDGDEVVVRMGFPDSPSGVYFHGYEETPSEEFDYPIKGFKCYADGNKLKVEEKFDISVPGRERNYKKMFIFDVKFEKNETRRIRNKYKFSGSGDSIGGHIFSYSLSGGSLWKGKIQEAHISVSGIEAPIDMIEEITEGYEVRDDKFIWEFRDFSPDEGIRIYYNEFFLRAVSIAERIMKKSDPEEKDVLSFLRNGHYIIESGIKSDDYNEKMAETMLDFIRKMPDDFPKYEHYPRVFYYLGEMEKAQEYSYKYIDGLFTGEYSLQPMSTLPIEPLIDWIARVFSRKIDDPALSNYAYEARSKLRKHPEANGLNRAKGKKRNYEKLGDIAKEEKKYEKAIKNYKKSLEIYTIDMENWDDFFKSLELSDGTNISEFLIQQENKRRASLLYRIGIIYEDGLEKPEKAEEYYKKLIEKYPEQKYKVKADKRLDILNNGKDN